MSMNSGKSWRWIGATLAILITVFFVVKEVYEVLEVRATYPPYYSVALDQQSVRLWFFSLECDKSNQHFYAKQAVLSALHFTDFLPVLMLHCKDPELEHWMKQHDVIIVDPAQNRLVKYLDENPEVVSHAAASTWFRTAIPTAIDQLIEAQSAPILALARDNPRLLEYVLYTDVDVVFVDKVVIKAAMLPQYMSLPIQGDYWCCSANAYSAQAHSSAGVMLLNVTSFREVEKEFTEYVVQRTVNSVKDANPKPVDIQSVLHSLFPIRQKNVNMAEQIFTRLYNTRRHKALTSKYYASALPKIYAWEPYLGANVGAAVLHWHGPKVSLDSCSQLRSLRHLSQHTVNTTSSGLGGSPVSSTNKRTARASLQALLADPRQTILRQLLLHNRTAPLSLMHSRVAPHIPGVNYSHVGSSAYPPAYEWYPSLGLSAEDERTVLLHADRSFSPLQERTRDSLGGYQHATSIFFSYMHIICSEL